MKSFCFLVLLHNDTRDPWWLSHTESACHAGDAGLIPGSGRSRGGGNDYSLHYSCLEKPMDSEAWGRQESDTTEATERARIVTHGGKAKKMY